MTDTQVQHKWLWAISPDGSTHKVIFVGHCRQCNMTYTEKLNVMEYGFSTQSVALPEWGCKIPPGFLA